LKINSFGILIKIERNILNLPHNAREKRKVRRYSKRRIFLPPHILKRDLKAVRRKKPFQKISPSF